MAELADLAIEVADGVYEIGLGSSPESLMDVHVFVEVADQQGNVTRVDREFSTAEVSMIFTDGFETGDTSPWSVTVGQ